MSEESLPKPSDINPFAEALQRARGRRRGGGGADRQGAGGPRRGGCAAGAARLVYREGPSDPAPACRDDRCGDAQGGTSRRTEARCSRIDPPLPPIRHRFSSPLAPNFSSVLPLRRPISNRFFSRPKKISRIFEGVPSAPPEQEAGHPPSATPNPCCGSAHASGGRLHVSNDGAASASTQNGGRCPAGGMGPSAAGPWRIS